MNHCHSTFILAISITSVTYPMFMNTDTDTDSQDSESMFAPHQEPIYWQALLHASRKEHDTARALIADAPRRHQTPFAWQENPPKNIDSLFDKIFIHSVHNDPELLTQLRLFESIGVRNHNAHLCKISAQALARDIKTAKEHASQLALYDRTSLSNSQKTTAKLCQWLLKNVIDGERFLLHRYQISQLDGMLVGISILLTQLHTINSHEDAQSYIERLKKIPQKFNECIAFMDEQYKQGIKLPQFALKKVISIIEKTIPTDIHRNALYSHLEKELHSNNIDSSDILTQAHSVLKKSVYPAYESLKNYCEQLLLPQSPHNHGVWAHPDGKAYYQHMLCRETTTDLSADEIYEMGLREVSQIQQEIKHVLASAGIQTAEKSAGQLMQEIKEKREFYYPSTQEGKDACLRDFAQILERSRETLNPLFNIKPKTGVIIKPVPAHEEEGMPAAYYYEPSADGSRPGMFFVNLRNMDEIPQYGMETLAIHEAEPGHHFQQAIKHELDIPMIRKIGNYNAYCEGWALYTEKLAYERGFYSSPYAKMGHLQDELLRAVRLVVDTGIHHRRWTREEAIQYMEGMTGYHHDTAVSEVERYFVLPGQACSYKIGQLKILELRKKTQDALGSRFDIREFHDEVLKLADAPLTLLEDVINEYIERKRTE